MSTVGTANTPATDGSRSTDPSASDLWRASRGPLAVLALVLLAGVLLAVTSGSPGNGRLDPDAPDPSGGRALAQVLGDQGVEVEKVTTVSAMVQRTAGGDTLLVVDPELLASADAEAVRSTIGIDLVIVASRRPDRFVPGVEATPSAPGVRAPGCSLPVARRAGRVDAGLIGYDVSGTSAASGARCFARDGIASLVQAQIEGRSVTLVGSGAAFTNARLDDEGNAALALGLLGGNEHLVWFLPPRTSRTSSSAGSGTSFYDLVPDGIWWGLAQLLVAVLLFALWRARRLGGVVPEPLPVVVRAAETVEGRARLYRRAGARDTAAEALRSGVRSRLVVALGLPRRAERAVSSERAAVVAAVSARSRSNGPAVSELLYGAAPGDDAALVRLADDLDVLEREVRRS